MSFDSFRSAPQRGRYWDDCQKALDVIQDITFGRTASSEQDAENYLAAKLDDQEFNEPYIDQRRDKDTMTKTTLFGSTHRPDMSVGPDGTAVEVKLISDNHSTGTQIRKAYGQSLMYRQTYRFVIVVLFDYTDLQKVDKLVNKENGSNENQFMVDLESLNIFTEVTV